MVATNRRKYLLWRPASGPFFLFSPSILARCRDLQTAPITLDDITLCADLHGDGSITDRPDGTDS